MVMMMMTLYSPVLVYGNSGRQRVNSAPLHFRAHPSWSQLRHRSQIPKFARSPEAVDGFQLPTAIPELPRDRIARRIIDVSPLSCADNVTCGCNAITRTPCTGSALLHIARVND